MDARACSPFAHLSCSDNFFAFVFGHKISRVLMKPLVWPTSHPTHLTHKQTNFAQGGLRN